MSSARLSSRLVRDFKWKASEHNQRAKYYELTAAGKKQLASEHSRWTQLSSAIASLMNPDKSEGNL